MDGIYQYMYKHSNNVQAIKQMTHILNDEEFDSESLTEYAPIVNVNDNDTNLVVFNKGFDKNIFKLIQQCIYHNM